MTLTELVRAAHDNGRSYREMSQRARRAGHEISHTQLADYGNGRVSKPPPSRRMAEAIAAAVGCSYEDVVEALYEQWYR